MTDFSINPTSSQSSPRGLFIDDPDSFREKSVNKKFVHLSYSKLFFKSVGKEFNKITDVAANVFRGVRAVQDLSDPQRILFSKRITSLLFFTSTAEFLLFPSYIAASIKDLLCFFTLKGILAKIDALLSFMTDATDLTRNTATLFSILQELRILSEAALRWISTFNVVAFFVDFIALGRSFGTCRNTLLLMRELSHDLNMLAAENVPEKAEEEALRILKKWHEQKESLASDLALSKKALQKRIDCLMKALTEKNAKVFEQTVAFVDTLYHRAKVQSDLAVINLVNTVVISCGTFMGFFPPLSLAATVINGATGIVSFVRWGITTHVLSKNPFGEDTRMLNEELVLEILNRF